MVYTLRCKGHHALCYLDDFVGVAESLLKAKEAYLVIADDLGITLSPDKCTPPTKSLKWLGYHISAQDMVVCISDAKLADVLTECSLWTHGRQTSKVEVYLT